MLECFLALLADIPERDPVTFFAFDERVVGEIFEKPETSCSLVFDGNVPVAGGFIWKPSESDSPAVQAEHEGGGIGLAVGEYLQLDNTVVRPAYRGAGLAREVTESLVEGAAMPVVATVAPTNGASLTSLERCGFRIQVTLERHGGFRRHVMLLENR